MAAEVLPLEGEGPPRRVARVAVDVPLAHLDRTFDYEVPDSLNDSAVPGCRVRVPFAGKQRDGWLIGFGEPEPGMKLARMSAVVSSEPLVTPALDTLLRGVADHYAGLWSDVARLAIPPRHATTEKAAQRSWPEPTAASEATVLPSVPEGEGFLAALAEGKSPRALWQAPAVSSVHGDITGGVVEAADATLRSGRGVIVVVPTVRDLDATLARFRLAFGTGAVAVLGAEQGRSARYRNYLAVLRGEARIVVGTRSAVFAPMADVGLVVVLDDGNDSHRDLRAPYPHSRTVAVIRSLQSGCGVLLAGHGRSAEAHDLAARGWLRELGLAPAEVRRVSPPVRITGSDPGREATAAKLRLPSAAFRLLRDALPLGPVLVQVPRAGFAGALACGRCRRPALCERCQAPLRMRARGVASCSLCGHQPVRWECSTCHSTEYRALRAGAVRTAEELARAFPGTVAINSSAERIRTDVPDESAIVVATPGAEPAAPRGYAAVLLLDTDVMLGRPDLRVAEESLRRWSNAMALCRPPQEGGTVLAVGETSEPVLQALLRGDLRGFMEREVAERSAAGLPPATKVVRVAGDPQAVAAFLGNDPFDGVQVLGPTQVEGGDEPVSAALLRVPVAAGRDLVRAVKHAAAIRSAHKDGGKLSVQVDPEVLE